VDGDNVKIARVLITHGIWIRVPHPHYYRFRN